MIWRCSMCTTDCTRSVRSGVRHAYGAALRIGQWLIAQRPAQRGALAPAPLEMDVFVTGVNRALAPPLRPDIGECRP
jgi:hypothetical protein